MRPLKILRVDDVLLEVIREFNPSTFVVDNSGEMNKQLIGAWVAHLDCDRVVRERGNKILIVFFALLWGWIIYEMHIAPELDDDGNIKIDITEEDLDIRDKNNRE